MAQHTIASVREMHELAAELVKKAQGGEARLPDLPDRQAGGQVWFLIGELGAGKTTFVQGVAAALGITERVTSPTFTIVGEYDVSPPAFAKASAGKPAAPSAVSVDTLIHVDLYRLDENTAASDPAVQDVLERAGEPGRLTVIEWADRLGDKRSGGREILFTHGSDVSTRVVQSS